MSEGRAQILEMLVTGRLTVEQADRLLEALDAPSPAAPHEPVNQAGQPGRSDERADSFSASLTLEQLMALRDHGVGRVYIEQMRTAGLDDVSVDDLIELYDHGVDATFVREMREFGLVETTPGQLIELYDHGVDAAFVREMRGLGFTNLTSSEWVALRDHGAESGE